MPGQAPLQLPPVASAFVVASDPGGELEGPWASSPWNLRRLPSLPHCVTSHLLDTTRQLHDAAPALAAPALRFSMLFACDGWRTHRHFMPELTYLHQGADEEGARRAEMALNEPSTGLGWPSMSPQWGWDGPQ